MVAKVKKNLVQIFTPIAEMCTTVGTVLKKAKPLNKLRPSIAGLRLPLGNLLF